jgi:hypothetical protein
MTTDYWEYRGFNSTLLNSTLHKIKNAEIMVPRDTKSYIQVWYKRKHIDRVDNEEEEPLLHQETLYQPPIFVSNFFKNDKTHLQKTPQTITNMNDNTNKTPQTITNMNDNTNKTPQTITNMNDNTNKNMCCHSCLL